MDALPPFTALGLDHLLLLVNDMDAAIDFYQMVIGATLATRLDAYGMAELTIGSAGIALVDWTTPAGVWARPPVEGGRNIDHFAVSLATNDEAKVRGHLAARGVPIVEEQVEDSRLSLYVRDPSGNTVELRLQPAATN